MGFVTGLIYFWILGLDYVVCLLRDLLVGCLIVSGVGVCI